MEGPAESWWVHILGHSRCSGVFISKRNLTDLGSDWFRIDQHLLTSSCPSALAATYGITLGAWMGPTLQPTLAISNKLDPMLVAARSNICQSISVMSTRNILVCGGMHVHCPAYIMEPWAGPGRRQGGNFRKDTQRKQESVSYLIGIIGSEGMIKTKWPPGKRVQN